MFDDSKIKHLRIQPKYLDQARELIETINSDFYKVFVHIRLGDYHSHTVFGKSVLLPLTYYYQQIDWFKKNRKNVFFVFLSDDPEKAERLFCDVDNCKYSKNAHPGVDFAIMTLCNGGILSPSSFSWWGSYLMKHRDIVFAPKYWLGFNSKMENVSGACPTFAEQIEVNVFS